LTIERSNTSSDPNIHGEYTLKFSGSFGQTGGVESGLFPVSELETYFINASCQVANAADKFEVQFVSYERDGSTSVQTVSNPFFTDANNSVSGWADSSMIKQAWPVNAGPDARFAKIRILFTVNSSVASEGYFDNLTIETIKSGQYNWVTQNFYGDLGGSGSVIVNNTLTMYIPETIVYLFAVLESGVTDASFIPWYVNQGGGQQGGTYPITYPSTSFNATTRILTINSGTNGNTNYDFYVLFKPKYTYDQYPGTTAD
jgi:hypothetical protein